MPGSRSHAFTQGRNKFRVSHFHIYDNYSVVENGFLGMRMPGLETKLGLDSLPAAAAAAAAIVLLVCVCETPSCCTETFLCIMCVWGGGGLRLIVLYPRISSYVV